MTAIAGVNSPDKIALVEQMLEKMNHRGDEWSGIHKENESIVGMSGNGIQERSMDVLKETGVAQDCTTGGRNVRVAATKSGLTITRDQIGLAPLYYGWTNENELCFASEVKGLLLATTDIHELPPGCTFDGEHLEPYFSLKIQEPIDNPPEEIARELRRRLEGAVKECLDFGKTGSWLSGGLDSSAIAAIASQYCKRIETFAVGLPDAPDLMFARQMAEHIHSNHHEIIVKPEEIIRVLPDVIYYLESFDALLVRSSIFNYLIAQQASKYIPAAFTGEGGDELFAGYEYLKGVDPERLPFELIDITNRLHNTALQRVDRCASASATIPHVCFLDPDVVEYALRIPVKYKLHNGVEKWILRQAVSDLLPSRILHRPKLKFWQGVGVEGLLTQYADEQVSMADFLGERYLSNGWRLNTKEELLYYRIFNQFFGSADDLSWMGRTKTAPAAA